MISIKTILAAATLAQRSFAAYSISTEFAAANVLESFDFFSENDPTNGFVEFTDADTAIKNLLVAMDPSRNNSTFIGVNAIHKVDAGRQSVRLTSKSTFNHGLFIADIIHMPGGICGVWPALWLVGPDWPKGGEIDMVEGVNSQRANAMTLHTSAGCSVEHSGFSGNLTTANCDTNAPGQSDNAGCAIASADPRSYGTGFNANHGGVYALEWSSTAIQIWFFARDAIPLDIARASPTPRSWGQPSARFAGPGCDIDRHFQNMRLVIDTTFCGAWAGSAWKTSSCGVLAPTCDQYVAQNPTAFTDAFWLIDHVRVYEERGGKMLRRGSRAGRG